MKLTGAEQVQRILWSIATWPTVVFFTATIAEEEQDPRVISKRWTVFIKELKRRHYRDLWVIRVLQEHPGGHGWHIHALVNRRIHHKIALPLAEECGLGRMDFQEVKPDKRAKTVEYLARYVARDMKQRWRNKALRGVRLITASGSLRCEKKWWVRLQDITIEDTGREQRTLLQRLMEINGILRLSPTAKSVPPVGMLDLLVTAPQFVLDQWFDACEADPERYGSVSRFREFPKPLAN